jgi:hypothetical protein
LFTSIILLLNLTELELELQVALSTGTPTVTTTTNYARTSAGAKLNKALLCIHIADARKEWHDGSHKGGHFWL